MTRVLMTTDAVGGVWTYAADLSAGLTARGWDVTLAVVGPPPSDVQRAMANSVPVLETGLGLDWLAETPAELRNTARALANLSRDFGADLVHLNSPAFGVGGDFGAPVLGVCHSCLATWWAAVKVGQIPTDLAWRTELQAEGMRACDSLIAPSRAFANAMANVYGMRPTVVLNGRGTSAWRDTQSEARVFAAGRLWDKGKNLSVLDQAANSLGLKVEAAGPLIGPQGQTVELRHIETLGSLSSVELQSQLARKPIFVSTALYEPFGLAVLEAAQAGCALVLSDIPTFRELWSGAAVFIDPQDPLNVATALRKFGANPDERRRWGEAASSRAAAYTLDRMVETTLGVYRALSRQVAPVETAA